MMIDRLIEKNRKMYFPCGTEVYGFDVNKVKKNLETSIVVLSDNVSRYYYEICDKEIWSYETDYPNILSPWNNVFFEWTAPKYINIRGKLNENQFYGQKRGVYISFVEKKENGNYSYSSISFMGSYKVEYMVPYIIMYDVDSFGNVIISKKDDKPDSVFTAYMLGDINKIHEFKIGSMNVPFLALSFCNCKNVKKEDIFYPQKINKQRIKNNKRPLMSYKVLNIDPIKEILRTEGQSETLGLKKALHICRGHFATYTQEAPLFGRVTGTFWKPMHVRGNAKEGVVVKDYQIKVPHEKFTIK